MKVAVVGVTGLVGTRMVEVLEERNFPVDEFIPVASGRSAGKKVSFCGKEYSVVTADEAITMKPDLALFSAGADISKEYCSDICFLKIDQAVASVFILNPYL